jgi:hypothetical protein
LRNVEPKAIFEGAGSSPEYFKRQSKSCKAIEDRSEKNSYQTTFCFANE